jgi:hypothetical protein
MTITRRGFLAGILAAAAAPAIGRASSLMQIAPQKIITDPFGQLGFIPVEQYSGSPLFTGEIGSVNSGFRFIESTGPSGLQMLMDAQAAAERVLMDSIRWGVGMARITKPHQREFNLQHVDRLDYLMDRASREPPSHLKPSVVFVHPSWADDLRKAGVPVDKKI